MADAFAVPKIVLPPLPSTERGYGIHVDLSRKDKRLMYCNTNVVVIRSLEDPSQVDLFYEHKTRVLVAKFSPNGEWVASGDDKGRVLVWSVKTKIIKNTVQALKRVLDIAWSDDGLRIAAVGEGNEFMAKVFAWDSGNSFGDIAFHTKPVLSVAWKQSRPYRIATAGEDNLANFYQGPPFKFDHSFTEHTRFVNCVRYSPDNSRYITVGADSKLFLFDGATGAKLKALESKDTHTGSIYSVSWSPDGKQVLTASGDKTAKPWNVDEGTVIQTFTFGNAVGDMQVSTAWDATHMLTVSLCGAINILDPDNPAKPKAVIHGHQHPITSFALDAKTNTLFTADQEGVTTQWDLAKFSGHWLEGKGHGKGIVGLAYNSADHTLTTVGMDDKLRVNELKSNHFADGAVALGGLPTAVAHGNKDPSLAVVTVAQGKVLVVRKGHIVSSVDVKYRPNTVAVSADDTEVAVGGDDKKLHIFALDGDTLKETTAHPHTGSIETVQYAPNSNLVVAGDKDRGIYVWGSEDEPKNKLGWAYHTSKVVTVAWDSSATKIASGSQDQNVYVWTLDDSFSADHKKKLEFAHSEGVVFSSFLDDNTLVTAGNDRCIKLWGL